MKKTLVLLSVLLLSFLAACGDSYDKEGFDQVKDYSEEIIPTVDGAIMTIGSWIEEPTEENLKMMEDSADKINEINDELWDFDQDAKYNKEEMEDWMIKMSRGEDEEWVIDGEELYPALSAIEDESDYLAHVILDSEDGLTEEDIDELIESASYAKESTDELRKIMENK